jgi:hypothetical protein
VDVIFANDDGDESWAYLNRDGGYDPAHALDRDRE